MKTISAEQAAREFEEYSKLAHEGERILVTLHGKRWILLAPATIAIKSEQRAISGGWPDFAARLIGSYPGPASDPTVAEILAEDRNDRF